MELVVLVVGAGFIAVVGVAIGMLVAPRLDRWAAPKPPPESPATEPATSVSSDRPEDEPLDDHT